MNKTKHSEEEKAQEQGWRREKGKKKKLKHMRKEEKQKTDLKKEF